MYDEIALSALPTSERLLAEDTDTPPLSQITQEVLQSVSYRLRDAEMDPRDVSIHGWCREWTVVTLPWRVWVARVGWSGRV